MIHQAAACCCRTPAARPASARDDQGRRRSKSIVKPFLQCSTYSSLLVRVIHGIFIHHAAAATTAASAFVLRCTQRLIKYSIDMFSHICVCCTLIDDPWAACPLQSVTHDKAAMSCLQRALLQYTLFLISYIIQFIGIAVPLGANAASSMQ
jgi:hypothetical protein